MTWQDLFVGAIVLGCVLHLFRAALRWWRGSPKGCGCDACPKSNAARVSINQINVAKDKGD